MRGSGLCSVLAVASVVFGCAQNTEAPGDAGADAAPASDGADGGDQYDDPSAFDRVGCAPGSLAGFDPTGVWHLDVTIAAFGSYPVPLRFAKVDGTLTATLNGREAMDVRATNDDLFVRTSVATSRGRRTATVDICALQPDGTAFGKLGACWDAQSCYEGSFHGVMVKRIAGEVEASGLEKVAEWGGDSASPWGAGITVNVRVVGGIAYLARYQDGLRIVDISDLLHPRDLGWSPTARPEGGEIYNDVKIVDDPAGRRHALMASDLRGVVAIDVSDPAHPIEVSTFPEPPNGESDLNVHTLFTEIIDGHTRAYIANVSTVGLDVFDVTDPAAPIALGSYIHPDVASNYNAYLHDLYVEGGRAYLDYWGLGLVVVDTLPDPAHISLVGQYDDYTRRTNHSCWVTTTSGGRKVAVMGDEDFTAHVRIVDVMEGSATFMQSIGELQLRPEVSVHNIMAFGDRAYIAYYQDGVRLLDLSDPTAPRMAAYFNTWEGGPGASFYEGAIGIDVDLASGHIYVADSERGLIVVKETH